MEENNFTSQQEKKKGKGTWKIVVLCVCCALIGAMIGGTIVAATHNHFTFDILDDGKGFIYENRFHFGRPFHFFFGDTEDIYDNFKNDTYIGVSVSDSDDPDGAYINEVEKGGPADKGGLQSGDVITMVNNSKIDDEDDLSDIIEDAKSGEELTLTVYRDNQTIEVKITVGERAKWH